VNFPASFLWGCATAALQIEGSTETDGRIPSIWDDFCRDHPDRIHGQATPEPGCDHYRRYQEDLNWLEKLGHNAYRFSISWPRVIDRCGRVNPHGLDFYDRLIDGLCQRQIAPMATLYHWDLPSHLQTWENPATLEAFQAYTEVVAARLGDRVSHWMSLNEPAWSLMNGYVTALHPPAVHDLRRAFLAGHQQMQAHHCSLKILRRAGVRGKLGVALNLSPIKCATEGQTAKDRRAARWADWYLNRWFLEAVICGNYPARAAKLLERTLGWTDTLVDPQKPDFLGVNYYYPKWVAHSERPTQFHLNTSGNPSEKCHFSLQGRLQFCDPPGSQKTQWDWEIDPDGLEALLVRLHQDFPGLALMVTENGLGRLESWGEVEDLERIQFVSAHLNAIRRALAQGAPVQGYLMWSLMDNFSWLNGYQKRYGLLAIHPQTLERAPKQSAHWYRQVFRNEIGLLEDAPGQGRT